MHYFGAVRAGLSLNTGLTGLTLFYIAQYAQSLASPYETSVKTASPTPMFETSFTTSLTYAVSSQYAHSNFSANLHVSYATTLEQYQLNFLARGSRTNDSKAGNA